MKVKTDTKEKLHVIRVETSNLTADMAADLSGQLIRHLKDTVKSIVLDCTNVKALEEEAGEKLALLQQQFYEAGASFVLFGLNKSVETFLDDKQLLEILNVTPTESEAWDIVQMEEIERELLNEEEE